MSAFPPRMLALLPNPLPKLPYDLMAKQPLSGLTGSQISDFLSTPSPLTKRQISSTSTNYLTTLQSYCNLDAATSSSDVAAGCLAAVVYLCQQQRDMGACHSFYDIVFARSIYSSIGATCPAWKYGPHSAQCFSAVSNFVADLKYTTVSQSFAQILQAYIFSSPVYAPCRDSNCKW